MGRQGPSAMQGLLPSASPWTNVTALNCTVIPQHISKTGMSSLCKEISQRYGTTDLSTGCHWHEQCFDSLYSEDASPPAEFRLTLFREPRSHVLSQYMECAFSEWGQRNASSNFPRGKPGDSMREFGIWLAHFRMDGRNVSPHPPHAPIDHVPFSCRHVRQATTNLHYPLTNHMSFKSGSVVQTDA